MAIFPGTYPLELSIRSKECESGPALPTLNLRGIPSTGHVSVQTALTSSTVIVKGTPDLVVLTLAAFQAISGWSRSLLTLIVSDLQTRHVLRVGGTL